MAAFGVVVSFDSALLAFDFASETAAVEVVIGGD